MSRRSNRNKTAKQLNFTNSVLQITYTVTNGQITSSHSLYYPKREIIRMEVSNHSDGTVLTLTTKTSNDGFILAIKDLEAVKKASSDFLRGINGGTAEVLIKTIARLEKNSWD